MEGEGGDNRPRSTGRAGRVPPAASDAGQRNALSRLGELASEFPQLRLLLLVGSRARGQAHPGSDWDFAYLAEPDFDVGRFLGDAGAVLGTDAVDAADLDRANALFRFDAADVGRFIAGDRREHRRFREQAVRFWCDAEPVLRSGYEAVLARLG